MRDKRAGNEAFKIFEISPDSEVLDTENVLKYFHPEDKIKFITEWEEKSKTEKFFEIEPAEDPGLDEPAKPCQTKVEEISRIISYHIQYYLTHLRNIIARLSRYRLAEARVIHNFEQWT